jgi:hypothetical protein
MLVLTFTIPLKAVTSIGVLESPLQSPTTIVSLWLSNSRLSNTPSRQPARVFLVRHWSRRVGFTKDKDSEMIAMCFFDNSRLVQG